MDELIDAPVVERLIRVLAEQGVEVRALGDAARVLDGKKVRQRIDLVRDALLADLPIEYSETSAAVRAALGDPDLTGWMLWPVSEAVVARALASGLERDFDDGMAVLASLTTRLTGEFAIRAMLNARLDRALDIAAQWTSDPDAHVRRLASEGTRPHLQWGKGVPALLRQPGITRPILDALYRDESEDVRRSVANHVNDLSRDDPDRAAEIVAGWLDRPDANTPRVARHALRTLVKQGHPQALALLGFTGARFEVVGPTISSREVPMGDAVHFTAEVTNAGLETARTAIDFVLHFRKASGGLAPKVFKLTSRTVAPGETVAIAKSYSFRPRTTRTFHPGEHALELQVNGSAYGRATFQLLAPKPTP
ncbi:DNA alkylation repair protein [Agrococcus sp. UYP33]